MKVKGTGVVCGVKNVPDRPGKRQFRFSIEMDYHEQRACACSVEVCARSCAEKDRWMEGLSAGVGKPLEGGLGL